MRACVHGGVVCAWRCRVCMEGEHRGVCMVLYIHVCVHSHMPVHTGIQYVHAYSVHIHVHLLFVAFYHRVSLLFLLGQKWREECTLPA